jgi:hypothetical protein
VDVQRALDATSDDQKKADELLEMIKSYKLDTHQKKRMVIVGREHPAASAKTIIEKALKPVVEQSVTVRLSDTVRAGLAVASGHLTMAPDEVAAKAIEEWLSSKGFIK